MTDEIEIEISHLQRRKIEGRVLLPFIETLVEQFGEDSAHAVLDTTINKLAIRDGTVWAETYGNDLNGLREVAEQVWGGGGSLQVEVLEQDDTHLSFNVTRCKYAEFYREMGLTEIGQHIHCQRDYAMIDGFNPDLDLTRTQTLMSGAACCDFRYQAKK